MTGTPIYDELAARLFPRTNSKTDRASAKAPVAERGRVEPPAPPESRPSDRS